MAFNFTAGNLTNFCGVAPINSNPNTPLSDPHHLCGYADLINLARVVINDLVVISTLLATAVIIFAGFKLITSGGNPSAMADAKKMLMKVVFGYMWILAAWLIIYTISSALLKTSFSIVLGQP